MRVKEENFPRRAIHIFMESVQLYTGRNVRTCVSLSGSIYCGLLETQTLVIVAKTGTPAVGSSTTWVVPKKKKIQDGVDSLAPRPSLIVPTQIRRPRIVASRVVEQLRSCSSPRDTHGSAFYCAVGNPFPETFLSEIISRIQLPIRHKRKIIDFVFSVGFALRGRLSPS